MFKNHGAIDTPAVLVNRKIMYENIRMMMDKARSSSVKLRPHTKAHRTPEVAKIQVASGANGITVAKVGEAEVMAAYGLDDIFIANEIYGDIKISRLRNIHRKIRVAVGVDNKEQVSSLSQFFKAEAKPIEVMIEVDVGEERTGVRECKEALDLAVCIAQTPGVVLRGIFSHEGHTYGAVTPGNCRELFIKAQQDTLAITEFLRKNGITVGEVSIGATPSLMHGEIMSGITEIRPGTYIYMDAAQGHAINDYSHCALTILATVVSKASPDRVVVDAGVKALTVFTRGQGICHTPGFGLVKGFQDVRLKKLYDEHGIIISSEVYNSLKIGDKIEIIPNHVCPTCNLYDKVYVIDNEQVVSEWPILCRGNHNKMFYKKVQ